MAPSVRSVSVVHVGPAGVEPRPDAVAVEEPLAIRVDGRPLLTTMRTPGGESDLAVGLLLAERVIRTPDDIATVRVCHDAVRDNVVDVTLVEPASTRAREVMAGGRLVTQTSACGVCGRQSIDDLRVGLPDLDRQFRVKASVLVACPVQLRARQRAFDETGGLHAAALVRADGELVAVAEDVGRHNAVDKVIGSQLLADRWPLGDVLLFVSGRTSFEIVQKAAAAGVPLVASVSAPSSLAIDLANDVGLTLVGFVRGETFTIYTHPDRVHVRP